jgi:hypothetical protein
LIVLYFNNLIKDKTLFTDRRQIKSKGGHLLLEMMKIGLRYVDKNSQGSGKGLLMEEKKNKDSLNDWL